MTGALDTKARANALRLIAKFGRAATWAAVGTGATYDPSTRRTVEAGASYTVTISPPFPYDVGLVDGNSIRSSDVRVLIAASGLVFTPAVGDRVTFASTSYHVVSVASIASGELIAAYEVQCRK